MDVDNELEGKLLQQFSSMGTTDKEVLISEFQKLLEPNQLNPAGCAFFLDMNNWNLQAAICSYYDYDQPTVQVPCMKFLKDVTIGEGEAVPPNTTFTKTWRIQNSGDDNWPPGCNLRYCSGDNLSNTDRAIVDALIPGQVTDVSVEMHSPSNTGVYQSQWRLSTPTGMFFGDVIWVIIQVDVGGLLDITQKMSKFGTDTQGHSSHSQPIPNPFASPLKSDHSEIPRPSFSPPHLSFPGSPVSNMSPNSSMTAQIGSPFIAQLSPATSQAGSPYSQQMTSTIPSNFPAARSLFQAQPDKSCDVQDCTSELDIS